MKQELKKTSSTQKSKNYAAKPEEANTWDYPTLKTLKRAKYSKIIPRPGLALQRTINSLFKISNIHQLLFSWEEISTRTLTSATKLPYKTGCRQLIRLSNCNWTRKLNCDDNQEAQPMGPSHRKLDKLREETGGNK